MSSAIPQFPSNPAENRGPELFRVTIALGALATCFVLVRLSVRHFISKVIGWDDCLIILAGLSNLSVTVVVCEAVVNGLGKHLGDTLPTATKGLFWVFVAQNMLSVTQVLTKLSIGTTLLRIAVQKRYRIAIFATMIFMVTYLAVFLFVTNLNCKDIRANWDASVERQCIPQQTYANITYVIGACNILTDLLFAILIPFPMIWQLNTNKRTKGSAMFVISLGAVACAAGIARMPYLINFGRTLDTLWDMAVIGMWSVVETNVSIIASCIPALRPLFRSFLETSAVQTFTRRFGGSANKTTNPISHANYPKSSKFTQLSERYLKTDDCESDGTSERALVRDGDNHVPLDSIQKTISSTVVRVDRAEDDVSKPASWRLG